jgi:EmrB/QacA subfamily drug resistance transporter
MVQDANGHPYIGLLIFFRVIQGIGGGALFPLSTAIAFSVFPGEERANSSAIIGVPVLMAPAFGPTVGGLLIDSIGWQWIFFINVPVGAIAIFLLWRIFRPDTGGVRSNVQSRFDLVGLTLSMAGVVALVYGFTIVSQRNPDTKTATNPQGDVYGWSYGPVWALAGFGLLLLVIFAVYELRTKDPVMDLRLFRERNFLTSSIMTWALRGFIFGSFFLLPLFLESIRYPHFGATEAGLATMPMGLASAVSVVLVGKFYNRLGPRTVVLIGMLLLAASNFLLLGLTNESDPWSLAPAMILRGLGFGATGIPLQTLALSGITGPALAKGSSLYNVSAQIFSSIGIAVLATLFVQQTTAHLPAQAQITQIAQQVQQQQVPSFLAAHPGLTPATIQTSSDFPALQQSVQAVVGAKVASAAGVPAMVDVFWVVTIAMFALILLSFILPSKIRYAQAPQGEGAPAEEKQPAMAME